MSTIEITDSQYESGPIVGTLQRLLFLWTRRWTRHTFSSFCCSINSHESLTTTWINFCHLMFQSTIQPDANFFFLKKTLLLLLLLLLKCRQHPQKYLNSWLNLWTTKSFNPNVGPVYQDHLHNHSPHYMRIEFRIYHNIYRSFYEIIFYR